MRKLKLSIASALASILLLPMVSHADPPPGYVNPGGFQLASIEAVAILPVLSTVSAVSVTEVGPFRSVGVTIVTAKITSYGVDKNLTPIIALSKPAFWLEDPGRKVSYIRM